MKIPEDLRIGTREIELMIPEDSAFRIPHFGVLPSFGAAAGAGHFTSTPEAPWSVITVPAK